MPRPVAKPLPPRPVAVFPRWLLGVVGFCGLLALASALLWKINRTNERLQADQRLASDPVLGAWLADMREEIAASADGGAKALGSPSRLTEAVWLGRIKAVAFTTKQGEGPRLSDVVLEPSHLVAGTRGALDPRGDGAVEISVLAHQWLRGEPREGESWVIAVYRINKGNNVARAAYRAP